ncbi:class I SAM-dependent methyltransferase [Patescibacteria group bacterium]|nr:class I SAM-dependent methyltransferase [Patescibacteria group bacterium]
MKFTGERVVPNKTPKRIVQDHIERYAFAAQYVKKKNVLDIACGAGYGTSMLAKSGAEYVTGVDNSIEAIEYAQRKYSHDALTFIEDDAEKLSFPNNSFDVVVSFETIEHVSQYKSFISEVHRVLKKKGILILSSPNRTITSPNIVLGGKPLNPFHFCEFTKEELLSVLSGKFKGIVFFGQRFTPVFFTRRKVRKGISGIERIFSLGIKKKIFEEGTGPKVTKKSSTFWIPRYYVALGQKR